MQFSDYQNLPSNEKITLAILSASKRLMGWSVHSGSVYKIENFPFAVIESFEDSGSGYSEAADLVSIAAGKYYLDRSTKILYVETSESDNPNSRFLVVLINLFFSNVPIALTHNLSDGFDVYWEPLIKTTSQFGVAIDTIAQVSEALEGSGSLTLHNDFDFWPQYFDKLSFENQKCRLYSYHRDLEPSAAQLIYNGKVEKRSYANATITFQLKDQFAELRAEIPLPKIVELEERTSNDLAEARQRMVLGRVFGHVPINIDQVLAGYPLTGTISIDVNSAIITGSGTQFLAQLSPKDRVIIEGLTFTVAVITGNTSATLTEEYSGTSNLSGVAMLVIPDKPKRFINRRFKVAGHALRQPVTEVLPGSSIIVIRVADTTDIYAGDFVYFGDIGSGELVQVEQVVGQQYIRLSNSLLEVPSVGTSVLRPAVQNVRINDVSLRFERDYLFDPTTSVLTLENTAEANAGQIYQMAAEITIGNGTRTVTGSGFQGNIHPGYMIGVVGNATFYEVQSVESDTSLTLREPGTFSSTATGRYKSLVFDPNVHTLSLDTLGRTVDGTSTGVLLKTAPAINKALLQDVGLGSQLDLDSFSEAEELAYQHIGLVVPDEVGDISVPTYRDVLNRINKSVFGSLVQNSDFQFSYHVLRAKKSTPAAKLSESDLLTYSFTTTAENMAKTVVIEYRPKEFDYTTFKSGYSTKSHVSDNASYILKTDRIKTIPTVLVDDSDAEIWAARWSFILHASAGRMSCTTKLQGMRLEIGNIIEIEHRKFFERFGSTGKRKLLLVESVTRSGSLVRIEATDLSNLFNRVASINQNVEAWSDASDLEKLYGGYYTDQFGLIDNNPESFETNLIW